MHRHGGPACLQHSLMPQHTVIQICKSLQPTWHALHARGRSWRLKRRAEAERQAALLQVSSHPGVQHRLQGLPLHWLVGPGLLAQGAHAGEGGNAGRRGAIGCSRETLWVSNCRTSEVLERSQSTTVMPGSKELQAAAEKHCMSDTAELERR